MFWNISCDNEISLLILNGFFFGLVSQERHNAKTVGEIKQFVSQLPHMQAARSSLANHTSIAELIKDITSA